MAQSEQKFMNKYSDKEIIRSFLNAWCDGDPDDFKFYKNTKNYSL